MSDQLQMFEEQNSQESTLSLSEVLVKTLALLEKEKVWKETDQALSLKQLGLSKNADQIFLSGKMLKEHSHQTIAKTLQQSCKRLPTLGVIDLNGNCLIQSWFLPQNRERIYLVGYSPNRSRGQVFPIGESCFKNIKLQRQQGNTCTLTTRYEAGGNGSYIIEHKLNAQEEIKVKSATKKGYEIAKAGDSVNLSQPNSKTRRGRVGKQQAQTLETSCNQGVIGYTRDNKGKVTSYHEKDETNTLHSSSGGGGNTDQFIKYNYGQKSLNETLEKENISNDQIKALDLYNKKARDDSPTLTEPHHNSLRLFKHGRIRKLTPIECERLQGFPDNWTLAEDNSDTQRYKMCGNAVTVDVVREVAKRIKKTLY